MMHFKPGYLRAYLDRELPEDELGQVHTHLQECQTCREQVRLLDKQAKQVNDRLDYLAPQSLEDYPSSHAARIRFDQYILKKEKVTMLSKLSATKFRPVWVIACLILILAITLTIPQVRAMAGNFLGLFRVQEIAVVAINPGNLPQQLGSSTQLEEILAKDLKIEEKGEHKQASDSAEASATAGYPVRLPTAIQGAPALDISPAAHVSFEVDMQLVQAVLDEVGRGDLALPEGLDGAQVTVDLPRVVTAMYGDCSFDAVEARQEGYDPDDASIPRLPDCTTFVQMPSPEVNAPPGLDIAKIGEAFLQILGMSAEEAASFSQNIDWTTTLVLPLPMYANSFEEVTVNGVKGTLIRQDPEAQSAQYILLWVQDGYVYALAGPGDKPTALTIANSLK